MILVTVVEQGGTEYFDEAAARGPVLQAIVDPRVNSRSSCQIPLTKDLNRLVANLPRSQY